MISKYYDHAMTSEHNKHIRAEGKKKHFATTEEQKGSREEIEATGGVKVLADQIK